MVYVATSKLFKSPILLTGKTGCDKATPVENGKQSNADAPRSQHLAQCCGIFIKNIVSGLEEEGNSTGRWYKSKYLSGNPSKYQVLVMSRANQEVKKAVHIDGHAIRQAQEIKLLG